MRTSHQKHCDKDRQHGGGQKTEVNPGPRAEEAAVFHSSSLIDRRMRVASTLVRRHSLPFKSSRVPQTGFKLLKAPATSSSSRSNLGQGRCSRVMVNQQAFSSSGTQFVTGFDWMIAMGSLPRENRLTPASPQEPACIPCKTIWGWLMNKSVARSQSPPVPLGPPDNHIRCTPPNTGAGKVRCPQAVHTVRCERTREQAAGGYPGNQSG